MSDGQTEACEAQADHLEQDWLAEQDAAEIADLWGDDAPPVGSTPESQKAWEPGGDREAEWAVDVIVRATAERDRIRANAQAAIDRIQTKALRDEARSVKTIEFMTGKLIGYRRRLEAADPKLAKTYRLANGDLTVRAGRPSVKVIDESAFVDWASDNRPSALIYKPKVSALKDCDRADDGYLVDPESGEIIPGVVELTAEPTYSVKPSIDLDPF